MTLRCATCGSYDLVITSQSYTDDHAFEAYECEHCGATGRLAHESHPHHTTLSGSIESDELGGAQR